MTAPVRPIDLKTYLRVARQMHPAVRGLALLDANGSVLKASSRDVSRLLDDAASKGAKVIPRNGRQRYVGLTDSVRLLAMPLGEDAQAEHYMCLVLDTRDGSANPFQSALLLRKGLHRELELSAKLDAMASELAVRYEELSLVYQADDEIDFARKGRRALQAVVDNCVEFLGVAAAILVLRDKHLRASNTGSLTQSDAALAARLAEHEVYDAVLREGDAVVVNAPNAPGNAIGHTLPFRLLACPVAGAGGRMDGVLMLVNGADCRSFTNTDRNLLTVMARQVAKTIQGSYDSLTGLLSRSTFERFLAAAVSAIGVDDRNGCLLHLNIDHLHRINDTLGLEVGDRVIKATAETLGREMASEGTLSRIGGDEFAAFIPDCDESQGIELATKLTAAVAAARLEWNGEIVQWTASTGVTCSTSGRRDTDDLMHRAAVSCKAAGELGGNRVQSYETADTVVMRREDHVWMIGKVHAALRDNGFELFGQTILPFDVLRPPHVEVLLRMKGDERELILPASFLPASERYRLMMDIDRWVVQHVLEFMASRNDLRDTVVAINLSGHSIGEKSFLADVLAMLRDSGVARSSICFEVTETAAVANLARARRFMDRLLEEGVRFALDDFGAGMSSFGYLKELPVQYLKIDGSLVKAIARDPIAAAMVESINQIGHMMKLETIAEYVENNDILARVKAMGIDFGQGYAIARPEPLGRALDGLVAGQAAQAV